jgi:hypothetical protein
MLSRLRALFGAPAEAVRVEVLDDLVWISTTAKHAGIRRAVRERLKAGAPVVVLVAHFPDVLAELETIAAEFADGGRVRALLARQLTPDTAGRLSLGEHVTLELVAGERHPLPEADAELLSFAGALPCRSRLEHHLSFDDALLQMFGGESARGMMERLGATEDEPVTSGLVTRSIRRAQAKVAAGAVSRMDADSAAVWLERNTRDRG